MDEPRRPGPCTVCREPIFPKVPQDCLGHDRAARVSGAKKENGNWFGWAAHGLGLCAAGHGPVADHHNTAISWARRDASREPQVNRWAPMNSLLPGKSDR